jgi:DnaJ like chaperone protein
MWGKVFGAMIGAAVGLLLSWSFGLAGLLSIIGAVLGHLAVDRELPTPRAERPPSIDELVGESPSPRRPAARPRPPPQAVRPKPSLEAQTLAELLCPIFIEVARCDGPVVQLEIRVIREFFQHVLKFDEAGSEAVRLALKSALAAPAEDVEALVKRARVEVKPSLRLDVVRALYDLGLADAELTRSEVDTLKRVVNHFNLSDEQLQQITALYFGRGEQHYQVLGLAAEASDDDLRAAFRKLAAQHHPDRAASLGAAEAEAAAERFRQLKDAYEALRKIRGF